MYWRAAILVVVALVVPFISADGCDTNEIFEGMDVIRKFMQEWQSLKNPTSHQLLRIMDRFESLAKDSDHLKAEECNAEQQEQLTYMMMFPIALLADEHEAAEGALSLIKDEKVLEHITSLICSFDCNAVLDFAQKAKAVEARTHTYNTLNNLLKYTDLNNTVIDMCVPFIKHLHKHVGEETDETVLPVMKTLLHQAIKTDLILEHHNAEALYAIDKELTSAVVQELITENLNVPLKDDDAIEEFPLFEILKCPEQLSLWIEHLELVFNKLKENNKLKSVYSLILLKNINLLEEKVQEEDKQKLAAMEKELPVVLQKLLDAELCIQFDDDKKTKAFVSSNDEIKKFVPKEDGSVTLINAHMGDEDYTLLLEKTDDLEGVFDFPYEIEHGELEPVTPADYCSVVGNVCTPYTDVLPQIDLTTKHFGLFKKFVKFYIAQMGAECANEA